MHQPVGKRAAIVVAGPLANFVLAIVIFAGVFMFYGKQSTLARVDAIQPDSAAAAAGFQPGDVVLSIDGRPIESFADMQRIVSTSAGETLTVVVDRGGWRGARSRRSRRCKEVKDNFGNVHRIGVLGISRSLAPDDVKFEPVGPLTAIGLGVQGNLVRHRPHDVLSRRRDCRPGGGGPARRPDPHRPSVRPGGDCGLFRPDASCRRAFGLDRPV